MKNQSRPLLLLLLTALSFSCQTESPESEGTVRAKKLSYYTEFFYDLNLGFTPQLKVRYEYTTSDKLSQYFVYGFDPAQGSLVELKHYDFTYSNNRVEKITGYLPGNTHPIVQYSYEYSPNLEVSKIKEENFQTGINSEVSLTHDLSLNTVTALYTFSNGNSFSYTYELVDENISTDKTTRGSEICSTGVYTYDNGINPFSLLGYTDYTLNNVSVNNKLTESVDYINCSFPSFAPESYTHVYDSMGYPITSTTYYKSGGMSRKLFIYK